MSTANLLARCADYLGNEKELHIDEPGTWEPVIEDGVLLFPCIHELKEKVEKTLRQFCARKNCQAQTTWLDHLPQSVQTLGRDADEGICLRISITKNN
jgi:hypothetical protein